MYLEKNLGSNLYMALYDGNADAITPLLAIGGWPVGFALPIDYLYTQTLCHFNLLFTLGPCTSLCLWWHLHTYEIVLISH